MPTRPLYSAPNAASVPSGWTRFAPLDAASIFPTLSGGDDETAAETGDDDQERKDDERTARPVPRWSMPTTW